MHGSTYTGKAALTDLLLVLLQLLTTSPTLSQPLGFKKQHHRLLSHPNKSSENRRVHPEMQNSKPPAARLPVIGLNHSHPQRCVQSTHQPAQSTHQPAPKESTMYIVASSNSRPDTATTSNHQPQPPHTTLHIQLHPTSYSTPAAGSMTTTAPQSAHHRPLPTPVPYSAVAQQDASALFKTSSAKQHLQRRATSQTQSNKQQTPIPAHAASSRAASSTNYESSDLKSQTTRLLNPRALCQEF